MSHKPFIYVRLSAEMKTFITAAAAAEDRSENNYCSQRLKLAAEKDLGISFEDFMKKSKK